MTPGAKFCVLSYKYKVSSQDGIPKLRESIHDRQMVSQIPQIQHARVHIQAYKKRSLPLGSLASFSGSMRELWAMVKSATSWHCHEGPRDGKGPFLYTVTPTTQCRMLLQCAAWCPWRLLFPAFPSSLIEKTAMERSTLASSVEATAHCTVHPQPSHPEVQECCSCQLGGLALCWGMVVLVFLMSGSFLVIR